MQDLPILPNNCPRSSNHLIYLCASNSRVVHQSKWVIRNFLSFSISGFGVLGFQLSNHFLFGIKYKHFERRWIWFRASSCRVSYKFWGCLHHSSYNILISRRLYISTRSTVRLFSRTSAAKRCLNAATWAKIILAEVALSLQGRQVNTLRTS